MKVTRLIVYVPDSESGVLPQIFSVGSPFSYSGSQVTKRRKGELQVENLITEIVLDGTTAYVEYGKENVYLVSGIPFVANLKGTLEEIKKEEEIAKK